MVCGVVSFFAMVSFLKKEPAKVEGTFVGTAMGMKKGDIIKKESVKLVPLKVGTDAAEYFTNVDDVIGKEIVKDTIENYPLARNRVKTPEVVAVVPAFLPVPPGSRALTLASREIENIPEPLELGAYVDVLGMGQNNEGVSEMQTVVTGAKVISVLREKTAKKEEIGPITTVTLAMSPQAVVFVTKSVALSRIRLIVRPEGPGSEQLIQGAASMEIIRGVDKEKKLLSAAPGSSEQRARD